MPEKTSDNSSSPESPHHSLMAKGVLCGKCDHMNPPGSNECEYCNSHLWVTCNQCGARVQRVMSRCTKCGVTLHKSGWKKLKKKLHIGHGKLDLKVVVLWFIFSAVFYFIISRVMN